jgi:hypothetical protein
MRNDQRRLYRITMKRLLYSVVCTGALILASIPAIADHVTEPTLPIEGLTLKIWDYPDSTTQIVNCDGSETRAWEKARIEGSLSFQRARADGTSAGADPSEHFRVEIIVSTVTIKNNGDVTKRKDWDAEWRHQNREAHSNTPGRWTAVTSNTYGLQSHLGLWEVVVRVIGDESGVTLQQSCMFRVTPVS